MSEQPADAAPQTTANPPWPRAAMEWVGDRLNPILVKETRQALKSRQFTLWFVLLLIGVWVTTIGAVAIIGPSIYYVSAGPYLLFAYYVLLALPLVVVVPFSAYRSLASEHEESTRDLLEVSTLTPRQVINGKLGGAVLQIAVYLSALAPAIAFTHLLRGVTLTQIGLLVAYAVLASIGLSACGLVLAAITRQKHTQVVVSVAFAGGLFSAFSGLLGIAGALLQLDAVDMRDDGFWWGNLAALSLFVTTFWVVHSAAVSLTTFSAANRSTGLRVAAFVQQSVFVAWVAAGAVLGGATEFLFALVIVAAVYWFGAGAIMTGESPTLSLRVRRSLPQSLLGRAVGTWFNPGSGSGYVFAVANLATCCSLAIFGMTIAETGGSLDAAAGAKGACLLTAYTIAYLGIGRLAILGLKRLAPLSGLGCFLVQVLCVLGGGGLPYVVRTLGETVRVETLPLVTLPSPFWNVGRLIDGGFDSTTELGVLVSVAAAAAVLFLVNLALAGHEARQLRIAAPRRVVEDDRELKPEPQPAITSPWGDRAAPDPAG